MAEKGFDRALSFAEAAWSERSYLAGTGAVDRPQRSRCEVALQFGMVELLSAGRGDDVPGPLLSLSTEFRSLVSAALLNRDLAEIAGIG